MMNLFEIQRLSDFNFFCGKSLFSLSCLFSNDYAKSAENAENRFLIFRWPIPLLFKELTSVAEMQKIFVYPPLIYIYIIYPLYIFIYFYYIKGIRFSANQCNPLYLKALCLRKKFKIFQQKKERVFCNCKEMKDLPCGKRFSAKVKFFSASHFLTKIFGVETMRNDKIYEYWTTLFGLAKKDVLEESELVSIMLAFHRKEGTPENNTRCLNKIFKDVYRGYLLFLDDSKRTYCIRKKI